MIYTMQGCSRSELSVIPKNWESKRASLSKNWRIYYRFYDPRFRDNKQEWGRMFNMRGMNKAKSLEERQEITKALIAQEIDLLDVQGWNPITCEFMKSENKDGVHASTGFVDALRFAYEKITASRFVLTDIRSVINGVEASARMLFEKELLINYASIPVSKIRHKHLKEILRNCYQVSKTFTDKRYNRYKDYLNKLFKELLDLDAIEFNPCAELQKLPVVKNRTMVLTPEQEMLINEYLRSKNYNFWRFMMIFFYSDARITELLTVRKDASVDLVNQFFYVTVVKGKNRRQVPKQISNEVLHLWQELWTSAKDGDYLFSKNLVPGVQKIRHDQPARRWARLVKRDLKIPVDFRALNHLHLTKVADALGIQAAAASRSHTTPVITMTRYDVNSKKRLLEEVKQAGVKFGG